MEEETEQITAEISETESNETVRSKPKFLFFFFENLKRYIFLAKLMKKVMKNN